MIVDDVLCTFSIKEKSVLDCLYRIKEIGVYINRLKNEKISIFDRRKARVNSAALQRFEDERSFFGK